MSNDGAEALGSLILFFFILVIVLYIIYYSIIILSSIGSVFGAGTALYNYGRAFHNNVRPEKVPS